MFTPMLVPCLNDTTNHQTTRPLTSGQGAGNQRSSHQGSHQFGRVYFFKRVVVDDIWLFEDGITRDEKLFINVIKVHKLQQKMYSSQFPTLIIHDVISIHRFFSASSRSPAL